MSRTPKYLLSPTTTYETLRIFLSLRGPSDHYIDSAIAAPRPRAGQDTKNLVELERRLGATSF